MKTDRELLEAAARAAGYPCYRTDERGWFQVKYDPMHCWSFWNPLTDDSANRRLQIKLKIPLQFPDWQDIARTWGTEGDQTDYVEAAINHNGDLGAATRRAIVRAAAAMAG